MTMGMGIAIVIYAFICIYLGFTYHKTIIKYRKRDLLEAMNPEDDQAYNSGQIYAIRYLTEGIK